MKSIPTPSSTSCKSVKTLYLLYYLFIDSEAKPIAIPATGFLIGIPAAISDKEEPQVEAIEDEPLEPNTSDTTRIA